ncbi:hypothetical protein V1512DRAFT_266317 [Lipomyces arxii]|uniref:uncharacterized protein n=1 Tax=Lipomyces arxii TaxID=56418 RepID=UPI0034CF2CDA
MSSELPSYNSVPRIKRSRKITICLSCYKRRVKCDKDKPQCKQCQALSIKCEYATAIPVVEGSGSGSEEPVIAVSNSNTTKRKLEHSIDKEELTPTSKRADVGILAVNNNTGETIYANTAYWPSFFKESQFWNSQPESPRAVGNGVVDQQYLFESSQCRRLIASYLPDKQIVDDLIYEFYNVVHPFCPVIDRDTFLSLYDSQFWDAVNDSEQILLITFTCLLFAVLYGGCLSRVEVLKYSNGPNQMQDVKAYETLSENFLTAFEAASKIHKFPEHPSLTCLVGCTIIQLCRRKDGMLDTTIDISRLIRIAQVMGLHRDPELFRASGLDDFQINLRRRLWWHLVHLDVAASLGNGVPCTTQISQFDVKLPNDEYLQLDEDRLYHSFMNSRWSGTRTMLKLLSEFYGINQPAPSKADAIYLELCDLRKEYTETKEKINVLTFEKRSAHSSLSILRKVQSQLTGSLDIVCEKFFLIYYLSAMSSESEGLNSSFSKEESRARRTKIVGTAMKVVKLFVKYSSITEYFVLMWSLKRYHQFHALILILRDIYQYPNDLLESCDGTKVKAEIGEPYDERVAVLEQGLATTEFLGLNSVSQLAEKQWQTFLRLKDVTWARKFKHSPLMTPSLVSPNSLLPRSAPVYAQYNPVHSPSVSNSAGHRSNTCDISPQSCSNSVPSGSVMAAARQNEGTSMPQYVPELNADEYTNFWTASEYAGEKGPGTTGNEFVQQLLAMNSWDIDWTAYGFSLDSQPRKM